MNSVDDIILQRFTVGFEYPVHFTRGVFQTDNPLLCDVLDRLGEGRRHRACVYLDDGLDDAQPALREQIEAYFRIHSERIELAVPVQVLAGGESAKSDWNAVQDILRTCSDQHVDRQSYVVAVGGGAMLDRVGLASSLVHRGVRMVRLPSTTLGQNDAGIGVKTGLNAHGQKNFVGTFAPPFAVINDGWLLRSLPQEHWIGGIAEAFKVAILKDAAFLGELCNSGGALRNRDETAMDRAIRRCAALHLDHIASGGDPFETGTARPLDFGHWAGHQIEVAGHYAVSHGRAVSVGIALDSVYAGLLGLISDDDVHTILTGLTECGLPIYSELLNRRTDDGELSILTGLDAFREHLGGALCVSLPGPIGEKVEVDHMDADVIETAVETLARRVKGLS